MGISKPIGISKLAFRKGTFPNTSGDMSALRTVFKSYDSQKFVLVEPGGNCGDSLIYRGAEKLTREVGIDFESISHQEFMETSYDEDTVIYIHGGGGFNPWWSGKQMIEFIEAYRTHDGILIQGPATVHADQAFLRERIGGPLETGNPRRVHFFTRERTSYDELKEVLPERVHLQTDHDTALDLRAEDLPGEEGPSGRHTFYAIRNDKESKKVANRPKPFRMWFDPVLVSQSFGEWVRHHAQAREVVTNRLHSAVLSSILGKPVTLLPNSYHKNRSVYEFSLAERGVEWQEKIENTTLDRLLTAFPTRLQRSYRLARGINNVKTILGSAVSLK